jgi:signal transduction histidine kinase
MLDVTDTGPGFMRVPALPWRVHGRSHREARQVDEAARNSIKGIPDAPSPHDFDPSDARPVHQEGGEGIGLSIVKRLCELLDATMEMESRPGEGTSLRIVFPRRYDSVGSR